VEDGRRVGGEKSSGRDGDDRMGMTDWGSGGKQIRRKLRRELRMTTQYKLAWIYIGRTACLLGDEQQARIQGQGRRTCMRRHSSDSVREHNERAHAPDVSLTVAAHTMTFTWTPSQPRPDPSWPSNQSGQRENMYEAMSPRRALLAILLAVALASASSAPQPPPCSRSCAALNCDCAWLPVSSSSVPSGPRAI
jgi:hypothetical protein